MSLLQATSSTYSLDRGTKLSVIIPVYNQERVISIALNRIKSVLCSATQDFEIVVVNDGSIDETLAILEQERQKDPRIVIVSYSANKGKGHAVKTGVISSHGKTIMFTDGDLDVSPAIIQDYIKELEYCDLVIASKRHPSSKVKAPWSRKFLSRAFNLFARTIVGIKIKDTQAGLKAGRGDALRMIFSVLQVQRYAFDVELLLIATLLGLNIKEMPIEINLDRRFKIRDIMRMLIDIAAIARRHRIKNWYQKKIGELNKIESR